MAVCYNIIFKGDFMGNVINVLDHGHVRLVEHMGSDLSIVRNARVSYDAEWRSGEDAGKDAKLINYLMKNKHTSPFESVNFTFDIKAPFFVVRQMHRHRTWSWNEISARYSMLPEEYYIPNLGTYGTQNASNKQMRDIINIHNITEEQALKEIEWEREQREHMINSFSLYHKHIDEGMPRELARIVLPMATYTHMFGTVDLMNLFKFIQLRVHDHSQYEIQVYATARLELIEQIVPEATNAFKIHNLTVGA